MKRSDFEKLLTDLGHIATIEVHLCRFGDTWQPICLETDCGYRGPFVTEPRAREIAEEHRLKTAPVRGIW